jgi:hypothetical protein
MIVQDYIMLIMNCRKYKKKAIFQKRTWLQSIPTYLKFYHVIGDITLDTEYKFDDEYNILYVKTPDDYNSLPKKVISAYEAIYNTFNFKYLFKTDDDQVLVQPQFFNTLVGVISNRIPKTHYGGFIVHVKTPHISKYHTIHPELPNNILLQITKYCSGRFYFLSKNAISNLISKKDQIYNEYFEDYAIGYYLDPIFKTNILSLLTNRVFTDIELSDFPQWVKEGKI